jgi:hypothetical protein
MEELGLFIIAFGYIALTVAALYGLFSRGRRELRRRR